jgi:hypothetical protein
MKLKPNILWDTNPGFPSSTRFKEFTKDAVSYSDNVWYISEEIKKVDFDNIGKPKLYAWVTETSYDRREVKEGQTHQDTAGQRVAQYQTTEKRIIIDIIVDDTFLAAGADQEFAGHRDRIQSSSIKWIKEERASDEIIYYKEWEDFDSAPSLRREALRDWTKNDQAGRVNLEQRVPSLLMLYTFFANRDAKNPVQGKMHIYELCARFGKTIWALSLFALSGHRTLIFGAYYLSSFGSIKNELAKWAQFTEIRYVDTRKDNWQEDYQTYIDQGYKVVVLCSLQATDAGWAKVSSWYDSTTAGMVVLDEVDFGVHTERTSNRLLDIISSSEVIGMSGTNADRMNNGIIQVCRFESYTMEQMLELKHALRADPSIAITALKNIVNVTPNEFWKNVTARISLNEIPELSFYQRAVLAETDMTFAKLLADPNQYKGVIYRDSMILSGADDEFSHLSIDNVIAKASNELVKLRKDAEHELLDVIEFVGYSTRLENLDAYASIRQQAFDAAKFKCKVIAVHGNKQHIANNNDAGYKKGQKVEIETSEHYVRDVKEQAFKEGHERVWIIASGMCQRSFSVGSLSVVLLSFDKGEAGGVNQRISRLGTPYQGKTAGLVISNSFAAERDDKIQMLLYKMTKSRAARTGEDLYKAMRDVKLGTSIFKIADNGRAIQYEVDEYLAELAKNKTGIRANVCKTLTRAVNSLDASLIDQFKNGTTGQGKPQTKLDSTFYDKKNVKRGATTPDLDKKTVNEILAVVENLVNNAHLIDSLGQEDGNRVGFIQSVKNICLSEELSQAFLDEFNLTPELFCAIIENNKDIELDLETTLSLNLRSDRELILNV